MDRTVENLYKVVMSNDLNNLESLEAPCMYDYFGGCKCKCQSAMIFFLYGGIYHFYYLI